MIFSSFSAWWLWDIYQSRIGNCCRIFCLSSLFLMCWDQKRESILVPLKVPIKDHLLIYLRVIDQVVWSSRWTKRSVIPSAQNRGLETSTRTVQHITRTVSEKKPASSSSRDLTISFGIILSQSPVENKCLFSLIVCMIRLLSVIV